MLLKSEASTRANPGPWNVLRPRLPFFPIGSGESEVAGTNAAGVGINEVGNLEDSVQIVGATEAGFVIAKGRRVGAVVAVAVAIEMAGDGVNAPDRQWAAGLEADDGVGLPAAERDFGDVVPVGVEISYTVLTAMR